MATVETPQLAEETAESITEPQQSTRRFKLFFWLILAAYFLLLGYDSITRLRQFSPDSRYYVEIARHIVNGDGLSYSTLDWQLALKVDRLDEPRPMTIWMPLYPLFIAGGMQLGVSPSDAALGLAVLFAVAVVLIVYGMARQYYDENLALLAAGYLSVSGFLFFVASRAWSETTGIAFLALAFWFASMDRLPGTRRYWLPVAAALAASGAFYARYAFLPMAGVVALILLERRDWRATLRNWVLFSGVYVLAALPILLRNAALTDTILGPDRPPSNRGILGNLATLYGHLSVSIFPAQLVPLLIQTIVVTVAVLTLLVQLCLRSKRARLVACLQSSFLEGNRYVFVAWAFGYLVYMVIYRSITLFDPLDIRLGSPGFIPLAVPVLAFLVCRFRLSPYGQRRLALVFALLALALVVGILVFTPPTNDYQKVIAASESKNWIWSETTPRDLIIGDNLTDIRRLDPNRQILLTYLTDRQVDQLDAESLSKIMQRHCGRYDRVFLVLSKHRLYSKYRKFANEEEARKDFHKRLLNSHGQFLADLIEGRTDAYPGARLLKEVEDGYIFSVECAVEK